MYLSSSKAREFSRRSYFQKSPIQSSINTYSEIVLLSGVVKVKIIFLDKLVLQGTKECEVELLEVIRSMKW